MASSTPVNNAVTKEERKQSLKGWFTKNASWVHMKEFSELIRMVYATYSNSSPIVRNLKIKNQR